MTQYNTLNVKLSNSQLNEFKSGIKKSIGVTLDLLSNMVGCSNDETNFPHTLLLTNIQVSNLCQAFTNGSIGNIKLSKAQLSEMAQLRHVITFDVMDLLGMTHPTLKLTK